MTSSSDQITAKFVEHVQQVWYPDGCDVKSIATRLVHVGIPPKFDVSTFCADIAHPPFNATAVLTPDPGTGSIAVCTLHEEEVQEEGKSTMVWPTILMGGVAVGLFFVREWCGGFDACISSYNASVSLMN